VFLPGAGTGGKTCPSRAMMAASDTVRRFRLPAERGVAWAFWPFNPQSAIRNPQCRSRFPPFFLPICNPQSAIRKRAIQLTPVGPTACGWALGLWPTHGAYWSQLNRPYPQCLCRFPVAGSRFPPLFVAFPVPDACPRRWVLAVTSRGLRPSVPPSLLLSPSPPVKCFTV